MRCSGPCTSAAVAWAASFLVLCFVTSGVQAQDTDTVAPPPPPPPTSPTPPVIDDNAILNFRPGDYVDDIYHCDNPLREYAFIQSPSDTISCDQGTFLWRLEELNPSVPPAICTGIAEVQPEILDSLEQVEDWFEPCLLWALLFGNLSPNGGGNGNGNGTGNNMVENNATEVESSMSMGDTNNATVAPTSVPDDLYHCRDPTEPRSNSISCNNETYQWNLDELDPNRPPGLCGSQFTIDPVEVINVLDWFEPCVLWAMTYGNLRLTASPTGTPTVAATVAATDAPTRNVTLSPTTTPTIPTIAEESSNVVVLEPLLVTFIWPSNILDQPAFSLDRFELRTLVERHVLEGLQASLGLTLVTAVNLILTSGRPTQSSLTETMTGTVSLRANAGIPSLTVQRLVQQSFEGTNLDLFQFRLQISSDMTLQQVERVVVGTTTTDVDFDHWTSGTAEDGTDESSSSSNENGGINMDQTMLIVIVSSAACAMVLVCCIGFFCLYRSNQKAHSELAALSSARGSRRGGGGGGGSSKYHNGSSIASSSRASKRSGSSNHRHSSSYHRHDPTIDPLEIPGIPTRSLSLEDNPYPPIYEGDDDDEENQMSIISMSQLDEESYCGAVVLTQADQQDAVAGGGGGGADEEEEEASVYSYFNHHKADNDSLLGGGSIANHSYLYSVNAESTQKHDDDTLESYSNEYYGHLQRNRNLQNKNNKKKKTKNNNTNNSRTNMPERKKKGLMWSVMDTMQKHFGDDTSSLSSEHKDDPSEMSSAYSYSSGNRSANSNTSNRNKKTVVNILDNGRATYESDNDSDDAGTLFTDADGKVDTNEKMKKNTTDASSSAPVAAIGIQTSREEEEEEVEDYTAEIDTPQATTTPVKERLERMWQQDDEEEEKEQQKRQKAALGDSDSSTEGRKNSSKGIKVFTDDNSGNGNVNHSNTSMDTDTSPAATVLLESARLRSAPPPLAEEKKAPAIKEVSKIVNHIPYTNKGSHDDDGDDDDDDDDHKMTLQLPSQLQTLDPNSDNISTSSSLSSRSSRSGFSAGTSASGSRNNFYGAANIKAQSVRQKRESKWGSTNSNRNKALSMDSAASTTSSKGSSEGSTDSAMYRTLLNQGDTNDARLFGVKGRDPSTKENADANRRDDASTTSSNSQLSSLILLSSLIKSAEDDASNSPSLSKKKKEEKARQIDDSDEEDVYVEGEDDEEGKDESDDASIKSGASRAVQELSSLLGLPPSLSQDLGKKSMEIEIPRKEKPGYTSPMKEEGATPSKESNPAKDSTPSTADAAETSYSFDSLEKKLSFEVVDSSDDESEEEKKNEHDAGSPDWIGKNMERLRRLSLTGYADTMASF